MFLPLHPLLPQTDQYQLFGERRGQAAQREPGECDSGLLGLLQQDVDELEDSWALHGLIIWSFKPGSTSAGLCVWSYGVTSELHTDLISWLGSPLLQTLIRETVIVTKDVLKSYEFMIKVQMLKGLGSILRRKWKFDTFKKAVFKVLNHKFLKSTSFCTILALALMNHSLSCFQMWTEISSILLYPIKISLTHATCILSEISNIRILCS